MKTNNDNLSDFSSRSSVLGEKNERETISKKLDDYIMATFTVPPRLFIKNLLHIKYKRFENLLPIDQCYFINNIVQEMIYNIHIYSMIKDNFNIYYELHKNGNIHGHCLIPIRKQYFNYEVNLITFEKVYRNKVNGNKFTCKTKFVFDYNTAFEYCIKKPEYIKEIDIGLARYKI